MPKFRMNVRVDQKGQVFNASNTQAEARRAVVNINDALAEEGVRRVKARLGQVLQNPTGFYESNIVVDRRQTYRGISDNGVIYGGWLEGITARNRASRFKGYHTFRLVKQSLDQDSRNIAEPLVNQFVNRMNN